MSINVCTETADAIANGPYTLGNGTEDLSASIQECFDNILTRDGVTNVYTHQDPYIPPGNWLIGSKINAPHQAGYSLRGIGAIDRLASASPVYRGQRTVLRWGGADGGTMFECRGQNVRFSDLMFYGENLAETAMADLGLLVTKGGENAIATGWMNIDRCAFIRFGNYGAQIGATEGAGELNCEKVVFTDCLFEDCVTAGLKNSGAQQLGNSMVRCAFQGNTGAAIHATGGGKFVGDHLHLLAGNITNLIKCDYVSGGFGGNNGDFKFRDTIIDNAVGEDPDFSLFTVNTGNVKLVFESGLQSCYTDIGGGVGGFLYAGTFGTLTNNSRAIFRDFDATYRNMIGVISGSAGGSGTPHFEFDNCECFDGPPITHLSGTFRATQSSCRHPNGDAIDDYPAVPSRGIFR